MNRELEQTILDLDAKRIAAMVARDVTTLGGLLGDDLSYTHSGGYTDTKASFLAFIRDKGNYVGVDFLDAQATPLTDDTVVVRGLAQIRLEGLPGYQVIFADVWTRRGGAWQLVVWQATRKQP